MSDFLKRLKESVDSGKPNDAIKAGFEEIISKADKYAASAEKMKAIEEKVEKLTEEAGKENAKKLTLEEVKALNEIAKQEEEKMLNKEQDFMIQSALISVEDKIERLNKEITELQVKIKNFEDKKKELVAPSSYKEKNELIKKIVAEINGEVV